MLALREFTIGRLADAQSNSLLMPTSKHGRLLLVGTFEGQRWAAFVGEGDGFRGMACMQHGSPWKGLIVPDLDIEIDPKSAMDARSQTPPLGALIRQGTQLGIHAMVEDGFGAEVIVLVDGLPQVKEEAAFLVWTIGLGHGSERRVLHSVSVEALG